MTVRRVGIGPRWPTAEGARGASLTCWLQSTIEARPIGKIRSEQAVLFFTDTVFKFGVSNSIITNNGTQFTGKKFLAFYNNYHIRVDWSAVAHP